MTRQEIEATLHEYLGVDVIVWLGRGHHLDRDTDGHVDAIAQYVRPSVVILHAPADPQHPDHASGQENLRRLREARDARGRPFEVIRFEPGGSRAAGLNLYLCNGAAIVPVDGAETDEPVLAQIRAAFPEREIVPVPGGVLLEGGGPHCITQQLPVGVPLA